MVLLPPFDLHVLGLPLAFILSQDQTLHCKDYNNNLCYAETLRLTYLNHFVKEHVFLFWKTAAGRCFAQPFYLIGTAKVCAFLA